MIDDRQDRDRSCRSIGLPGLHDSCARRQTAYSVISARLCRGRYCGIEAMRIHYAHIA